MKILSEALYVWPLCTCEKEEEGVTLKKTGKSGKCYNS